MSRAFTVAELAKYLGLARDTIYRKAKAGEIPGMRIGRSWRFPQDVIDEWLREEVEARDSRQGAKGKDKRRGGKIIGSLRRKEIYDERLKQVWRNERREGKKVPSSELRRRQRLLKRILETRKIFEKLPVTADEAYRISRRELERRPLRWK